MHSINHVLMYSRGCDLFFNTFFPPYFDTAGVGDVMLGVLIVCNWMRSGVDRNIVSHDENDVILDLAEHV